MQLISRIVSFFSGKRFRTGILIAVSCLGFLLGVFSFLNAQCLFVSWMRSALNSTVSIVGACMSAFLPLLLTAIAVMYSKPGFLYAVCFIKSFLYSVAVMTCYYAYGNAGWLVQVLLLFSDNLGMVLLWFVWMTSIQRDFKMSISFWIAVFCISSVVSVVNIFWISPFLAVL